MLSRTSATRMRTGAPAASRSRKLRLSHDREDGFVPVSISHVDQISKLVGDIAASAREEATGIGEVNTAVNQMDQVTQQNAAMVEETTAASRMLADQTEELFGLVSRFKLSGVAEAAEPETRARRAAPAYRTAGNAALAAADDDWTEF